MTRLIYPYPKRDTLRPIDLSIAREIDAAIIRNLVNEVRYQKYRREAPTRQLSVAELCNIRTFDRRQDSSQADKIREANMAKRLAKMVNA